MPSIRTTPHLFRYFPALTEQPIAMAGPATVADIIRQMNERYPGLAGYLVEDDGSLRKHVVVFVDNRPIDDRVGLSDVVEDGCEVFIAQALSGG